MPQPTRIAMWSGPRNISTAMMRAFENRTDACVVDEPFYGHFLENTDVDHPGREVVIASMDCDWRSVARTLTESPMPAGCQVQYQKHMCHHMLPGMLGDWMAPLTHCFLIRDPRAMLTSLDQILETPTLFDTGLEQQVEIFEHVTALQGREPPVVEAAQVLRDPERGLRALCRTLGIRFDAAMLSWPAGPRESDGAWAPWWYERVQASTGFEPYRPAQDEMRPELEPVLARCEALYARMSEHLMELD